MTPLHRHGFELVFQLFVRDRAMVLLPLLTKLEISLMILLCVLFSCGGDGLVAAMGASRNKNTNSKHNKLAEAQLLLTSMVNLG